MEHLLASELLAISQNNSCAGVDRCHWCGAPCDRLWRHDDPLPSAVSANRSVARCPGNAYVCRGCWIYRCPRVTVTYLGGKQEDRKSLENFSWYMDKRGVWVIGKEDSYSLYETLLRPRKVFSLSLLTDKKITNHIQLACVNSHESIKADTPLHFTINNVKFTYTVYDLEECLKGREDGMYPGAREIHHILGDYPFLKEEERLEKKRAEENKSVGRPKGSSQFEVKNPATRTIKK